ncbi:hypothetical protein OJF2_24980 [Aquisphaera giovannonii]|uniref:Uncharacterized protein n=1 Tax=Aquisphaera giovannonii TaxID=406548 RepID=A0A5B9W1T6_9BACT|nr:hypothetical protein OJF2_24980 [Aquisphaera giovannonii]
MSGDTRKNSGFKPRTQEPHIVVSAAIKPEQARRADEIAAERGVSRSEVFRMLMTGRIAPLPG